MGDERVYIMDVYNRYIYPRDMKVKGTGLHVVNYREIIFLSLNWTLVLNIYVIYI